MTQGLFSCITTSHYSRHVRDGKLGVGTASVLCIDVSSSKTRVHVQLTLMKLGLGMRSGLVNVIYMPCVVSSSV